LDPLFFEQMGKNLRGDDADTRADALRQLAEVEGIGALRMLLDHARRETEDKLLRLIGKMIKTRPAHECANYLRQQLRSSSSLEKCRLLHIMRYISDASISELAAEQFGDDDSSVTLAAFEIFGKLEKARKLSLLASLAHSDDCETRARAIRGLGKFANAEVLPYLTRAMLDKDYEVRKIAYEGIETLHGAGLAAASKALETIERPEAEATEVQEPTPGSEPVETKCGFVIEETRLTGKDMLLAKGRNCKTCNLVRRTRPDGKTMSHLRMWCHRLRKETTPEQTCQMGVWTS